MNSTDKKLLGRWGEERAAEYLKRRGYKIIGMNYSIRMGEVDLIAENRRYIVFVEVKTRTATAFAAPREYVTAAKQARIRTAAAVYLASNASEKQPRFDVMEILAPDGINTRNPNINHIENAFE